MTLVAREDFICVRVGTIVPKGTYWHDISADS